MQLVLVRNRFVTAIPPHCISGGRVDLSRQVPRYASYNVRRGDTLTGIAQRHSVALDALRKANGFSRGHWRIRIGERLRIPLN